jgi:hypothetical protein
MKSPTVLMRGPFVAPRRRAAFHFFLSVSARGAAAGTVGADCPTSRAERRSTVKGSKPSADRPTATVRRTFPDTAGFRWSTSDCRFPA